MSPRVGTLAPREVAGRPVYFRVFFVFGDVWVTWWNCYTDHYRMVSPDEWKEFELEQVEELARRIAALTGMTFFSTEIAQPETGGFVVIDYVNDQCHLLSQTAHPQMGVPDQLVASIARRLVEAAQETIRGSQTQGTAAQPAQS